MNPAAIRPSVESHRQPDQRARRGWRHRKVGSLLSGILLMSLILGAVGQWPALSRAAPQGGSTTWCSQNPFDIANLDGTNGFTIESPDESQELGISVAG